MIPTETIAAFVNLGFWHGEEVLLAWGGATALILVGFALYRS